MKKEWKKVLMIALVTVFSTGVAFAPVTSSVFAAEQSTEQPAQPIPPSDAPQDGNNEHAGHH